MKGRPSFDIRRATPPTSNAEVWWLVKERGLAPAAHHA
jgi:hypothetical protein